LRLGTPAITRRGFKEAEAEQVANWICDVLDDIADENKVNEVREQVKALCAKFPVYG
jgi:serine hydroxymethyltransferase (EC 2.1.2.1)